MKINLEDFRRIARRKLPRAVFEYIDGGSYSELTLGRNRTDLDALAIHGAVMRDVSELSIQTTLAGDQASMPFALAPVGMAGLAWPDGEIGAARAAEAFGVPFCLSTFSIASIEDVAAAVERPFWSQLYMMKQQSVNESLIHRALDAGCSALVMTLDVHVHSQRWADNRNGLTSPVRVTPSGLLNMATHLPWLLRMAGSRRWTFATMQAENPQAANVFELAAWVNANLNPSINADVVRWVRARWPRKLVLKGVMGINDAKIAIDLGADAIVVSNHGGRQLDSAPSSISMLPAIVEAVGDDVEVLWDGGVRTGFDIVKAMGLGAHGCLGGRSWAYAVAADGGRGVSDMLSLMRQELLDCMALSGVTDIRALPDGLVTGQQTR
ncbi:alpha-hydroxy-acid oxidizing protein [Sphingosinicellaceae bacterium]|nr:alpha-hydroxy-acid oxidizing protein [Sphingosinicellaceae bacterium]